MMYPSKNMVTRNDLATYACPNREDLPAFKRGNENAGKFWQPIPHLDLIEEIESASRRMGLEIIDEQYCTSDDGHDIFGFMRFNPETAPSMPVIPGAEGIVPELGFRHSNMQRMRLFGVHGERVGICSNGMIVGDFLFGCKTTSGNVSKLEVPIAEGMETWAEQAEDAKRMIEFFVETEISEAQADRLLMEGARRKSFAWNQLGKIDETYRGFQSDDSEYFDAFGGRTIWSLYNAVTEVAKGWSVRNVERGLKGFPRVLTDAFGFELKSELVEDAPEGAASFDASLN